MSEKLNHVLEQLRRQGDPHVRDWHGRLNYTSPRMAESWHVEEHPLSFERGSPPDATRRMLNPCRYEVLQGQERRPRHEVLRERTDPFRTRANGSRLSPFEVSFRIDPSDNSSKSGQRRKGFWARLFRR